MTRSPWSSDHAQDRTSQAGTNGVVVRLDDLEGIVGVTLGAAVRAYLNARRGDLARLSLRNYRYTLSAAAEDIGPALLVRNLKRKHIEQWMAEFQGAPSTARRRLSAMRGFCEWLVLHGHVKQDPTLGVKGPRQPQAMPRELETDQVDLLMLAVPDTRAVLMVLLAVAGGLRAAEIANAKRENVDLDGRLMLIRGKGEKERWIGIGGQLHETIVAYLAEEPGQTGYLIRSQKHAGRGISPTYVSMLMSQWMRDAGVKKHARDGRSGHALRHSMAGALLDSGVDIRIVSAALGHASLGPTMIYLRRRIAVDQLVGVMGQQRYGPQLPSLEEVA